jgi:hypothetical protein
MAKMSTALQLLLAQQQATFGTAETDLTAADIIETIGPAEFSWDPGMTSIEYVAGAFDQDAAVPGLMSYGLNFKTYMRTGGASGSYGQIDTLLLASGMTGATSSGPKKTYTFSSVRSEWKDLTVWGYSGDLSTTGALLRKAHNLILNPKFILEAGKPAIVEFSGMGAWGGIATTAAQPSITKARISPPAFLGASIITINGDNDYKLLKLEYDCGQTSKLTLDPLFSAGYGQTQITNRKIKWKATVYCDLVGIVDPETALQNGTEGAVKTQYGTAPNKITFDAPYGQITAAPLGDADGVQVWELEGQCNRNSFSIEFDTTVA